MCGIGGVYATRNLKKRERDEIALLFTGMMIRLEDRGVDASGIFVVGDEDKVTLSKGPGPAGERTDRMLDVIEKGAGRRPIIVGHTRHATHGSPLQNRNNHPFRVGRLVGVHNGVFAGYRQWAPRLELNGECDSEAIYRMLDKCETENGFFEVFNRLNSYNRLVFWDREQRRLYAYCHDEQGLSFVRDQRLGVVWFATTKRHLPRAKNMIWAEPQTLYIMTERKNGNGQAN